MSKEIRNAEKQIEKVKQQLAELGPMRPGSVSRQFKDPTEKKRPFYQISYTHQMKSRTEYVRKENLAAIKQEVANFKKFRKLMDRWVELALKLSQLKTRQGLHKKQS